MSHVLVCQKLEQTTINSPAATEIQDADSSYNSLPTKFWAEITIFFCATENQDAGFFEKKFCPKILGRLLSAYLHTPVMLWSGSYHVGPESLPFHDEERRWCSDPLWVTLKRLWLYLFHVFFRCSKSSSLKWNVFMLGCSSRRVSDNRRDIFMEWWAASSLDASCRAPFIKPLEDVIEHKVDILIWLTQCQAMPHPWIQLDLLVGALGRLVELFTDLRVSNHVSFPL